jgi:predicted kinase
MGTRIPSFSRLSTVHEQQPTKADSFASAGVGDNHTWTALGLEQPLVIAMVGLPARGKSYLVKMIIRYLKWTGFECQVFNVGSFRRQVGLASADSNFFDNSNPNNHKIREQLAMMVQDSMYKWLHETNEEKRRVAVFDATNTTKERRLALAQRAESENVFLLFVESICDDQEVLMKNYELKLQNEDYKGMDPDTARRDFISRVKQYERVYETITDDENNGNIAYIKLINVGQKVITRNCHGYLPSQVAFYLQNVHIYPRKIYLSVICETAEVSENVSGAESGELTEDAKAYVNALADFMIYEQEFDLVEKGKEILVLTGTAAIHEKSVAGLKQRQFRVYHTPILNELRGGDLHGLSKASMKAIYPAEYAKRMADKLNYRYPGVGGESYLDVIERVRPVIIGRHQL